MAAGKPPRVLICDDDRALVVLLQKFFHSAYEADVRTANNGEEALKALDGFSPDLIVLDHMMPKMAGLQTLQKMRQLPGAKGTRVLLYSAFDLRNEARAHGADAFLQKPASVDKIKAAVDGLLKGEGSGVR